MQIVNRDESINRAGARRFMYVAVRVLVVKEGCAMSMIGCFRRLPDKDLALLIEDPDQIEDYLNSDEGPLEGFGPFADLNVDKAWDAINFLLCEPAGGPPLNFVAEGGTEIGDIEVGYGPARGLNGKQVRELAAALKPLTREVLSKRFDGSAMMKAEVYPGIWDRPPEEDDTQGYVLGYYDELRDFILQGAELGEALIVYIA